MGSVGWGKRFVVRSRNKNTGCSCQNGYRIKEHRGLELEKKIYVNGRIQHQDIVYNDIMIQSRLIWILKGIILIKEDIRYERL